MTKIARKNVTTKIARRRRGLMRLQEAIENLLDYLAVLEARAKSAGGKRYSTAEVKRALGI